MKRCFWFPLAAMVLAGFARDANAQWPHLNEKLASKKVTIHKVVLLPAQVAFIIVGARGTEGGAPEADQLGASLYAAVSKELSLRGIEVLPNPLEQAKDDAAKYAIADLQARYDSVGVQMRRKPGRVIKGQITLGDRVTRFEPAAGADTLVFIRGTGQIATPARKAVAVAMLAFTGLDEFRGEAGFVDAKTGEVLAFIRFTRRRNMTQKSDERFTQSVRQALHEVPLPLPPPKG